jgi:hypothetical protein
MTGGGSIGTSGAGDGEPLAVGCGDKTPGPAGLLHHILRPLQWHVAAGGERWSVTDGCGAAEL